MNPFHRFLLAVAGTLTVSVLLVAQSGQPGVVPAQIQSTRIATLRGDLERGVPGAVDQFWRETANLGTPLVERRGEDALHVLVTFVWRGAPGTTNVVVTGQLGQYDGVALVDNRMEKLAGTDVWYRSYWLRKEARAVYRFAPNDSLTPLDDLEGLALRQRTAGWVPDPLNRRVFANNPDTFLNPAAQPQVSSLVELPDAPPQRWPSPVAGRPAGTLEKQAWRSPTLKNAREIWIYTPPGYRANGAPYPLLVTTDGFSHTQQMAVPTILDNLIGEGRIPPVVAVFVGNAADARVRELSCSEAFGEFLVNEIVPSVSSRYHVSDDAAKSTIAGFSLGGLTAVCTALTHPGRFGNVLSQSGSFWWKPAGDREGEWVARHIAGSARVPVRFYLDAGILEASASSARTYRWLQETGIPFGPSMIGVSRHLRDVLKAKGYEVHYQEGGGGHNVVEWRSTFADGLLALFGTDAPATARR